MQELYIGIAVAAAVLLLFVTVSIIWVARLVRENIHRRTLELLSDYDQLLDRQSQQLKAVGRAIEERRAELAALEPQETAVTTVVEDTSAVSPTFMLRAAERLSRTEYRDQGLKEVYHQMKRDFSASPQAVLDGLPNGGAGGTGGPATALLSELTYESCYQLSTLDGAAQYSLLEETLPPQGLKLLEAYGSEHKQFSVLDFFSYLQALAEDEPGETIIYLPPGQTLRCPPHSRVVEDEEICEGVIIEYQGIRYDYAIKGREIG